MKLTNPFSADGSFSAAEKLAALEREVARSRGYHQGLVDAKRMKPENFAAKIGALEAILEDLRTALNVEKQKPFEFAQFARVIGTIGNRKEIGFQIKPEAVHLDGQEMVFCVGHKRPDDDSRYPGEWELLPEQACVVGWIASGDVVDLRLA